MIKSGQARSGQVHCHSTDSETASIRPITETSSSLTVESLGISQAASKKIIVVVCTVIMDSVCVTVSGLVM